MRALTRTAATLAPFLAVGVVALTACSDTTSPQNQFSGTYSLRSVNGQPLPVVAGQGSTGTTTIVSDVFTFRSDGTLTEQSSLQFTPAAGGSPVPQNASNTGTWTVSGSTATVQLSNGTRLSGAFSGGNTLTVTAGTLGALVYQK